MLAWREQYRRFTSNLATRPRPGSRDVSDHTMLVRKPDNKTSSKRRSGAWTHMNRLPFSRALMIALMLRSHRAPQSTSTSRRRARAHVHTHRSSFRHAPGLRHVPECEAEAYASHRSKRMAHVRLTPQQPLGVPSPASWGLAFASLASQRLGDASYFRRFVLPGHELVLTTLP